MILRFTETMPKNFAGIHLAKQLTRSSTSPALNYGEAQGSESQKDFIHKMKLVLKELRETFVCLKILQKSGISKSGKILSEALRENNELISIFVKSVETASVKLNRK
jgi:four helix bundle protein